MREFQDEFDGRRVANAIERHRKHYSLCDELEWIRGAQFFFVASGEYVDCNIKSGDLDLVKIVGENVIE
ncbi:hypothetical protein SAMN05216338_105336 [Bradyrhizobium sp. Rc2d]|uniref:hypothetical protein n=1 Tax=Bradyrhizobium sp. Rc2d TaxID=1855321 RepID=UPI00088342D5|nr:hypothetical protein [Bradyrhizobium sp. Rc2d]SDJ53932.1 hypothetical protein SAMN05216338_105336 [Bradyrhizobium sp. Rc2d]